MALDFLSPGVVTEEVTGNSATIPQASTSTYGMVGYSPRGPENKALISGSFQQFAQMFGGFTSKSFIALEAAAYFLNGGNRLVFVRKLHTDATYATGSFPSTWDFKASGRGAWANGATIVISGSQNFFDPETGLYSAYDVDINLVDSNTDLLALSESYDGLSLEDVEDPNYLVNVLTAQSNDVLPPTGNGGVPAELLPTTFQNIVFETSVSGQSSYAGSVSGTGLPILPGSLTIMIGGSDLAKDDGNGKLITNSGSTVSGQVDYVDGSINLFFSPAPTSTGTPIKANYIKQGADSVTLTLAGGADGGTVSSGDLVGAQLQATGEGIYALDQIHDQMAIALPDFAGDSTTISAGITYCENRGDCVYLWEPPKGTTPQQAAAFKRNTLKSVSSYGIAYSPWVKVPNPLNNNRPILIPPSGHAAGRFAFTDLNANVGKAPAGVKRGQLSFISGVERVLTQSDRDILYQAQINPIRSDEEVGNAIWGNKTNQIVGDFTDVNIRRLFIYLRKVQGQGLIDIVFEDVGDTTFGVIKTRLDLFLEGLFLQNIIGSGVANKNSAFKVICDSSNNPEAIQIQKRIIVDEYIKPNLAAEVIHLRIERVFDASQT